MSKMVWAGYWTPTKRYEIGQTVVYESWAYIAKECTSARPTGESMGNGWVCIGRFEQHAIDHPWDPEDAAFPIKTKDQTGELSEVTSLCRECWTTGNFRATFFAKEHEYVIQEFP